MPVIATGRSRGEIPEIFEQAGIDTYVALNGDALAYYNGTDFRISRLNDLVKAQYDFVSTPYPQVERDFYQTNPVDMLLVITVDNEKRYTYPYGDELTFYRNIPYALDTVLKGESKQFGIRTLIDKTGLADVPTYAFGDGVNDIPMWNTVDHPIAMGNGITAVKDRAEYITAKNTEGGIIQGLRHFELLP